MTTPLSPEEIARIAERAETLITPKGFVIGSPMWEHRALSMAYEDIPALLRHIAHLTELLLAAKGALESAEEWLEGWASAEHELSVVRETLGKLEDVK